MVEIRNILLIGKTGNGKSTLGNVLINENNNFEEVFKESAKSKSETKKVKKKQFKLNENVDCCVIDTIGMSDTTLSKEEVLIRMKDISDGTDNFSLNQILFVVKDRITREEVENFNLLKEIIFDDNVEKYTTIVRTNFPSFRNSSECKEDIQEIKNESENGKLGEKLIKMINSCKILHVNNPSTNIAVADDESDGERENRENLIKSNKKVRNKSRDDLLKHLKTCDKVYKPKLLGKFHRIIIEFNSISKDADQMINNYVSSLRETDKKMNNFISKREGIIETINSHERIGSSSEGSRIVANNILNTASVAGGAMLFTPAAPVGLVVAGIGVVGSSISDAYAGWKEGDDHQWLVEVLKNDKEMVENLTNSWVDLDNFSKKFNEIKSRFDNSLYKEKKINEEKLRTLEEKLNKVVSSELDARRIVIREGREFSYSGGWAKAGRTALKTIFRGPIPSIYYLIDDNNGKSPTLSDMEKAVEELGKGLKEWKERRESLTKEIRKLEVYEKYQTQAQIEQSPK